MKKKSLIFFIAGVGDPTDKLGMHVQTRDCMCSLIQISSKNTLPGKPKSL